MSISGEVFYAIMSTGPTFLYDHDQSSTTHYALLECLSSEIYALHVKLSHLCENTWALGRRRVGVVGQAGGRQRPRLHGLKPRAHVLSHMWLSLT
jgi:hypothetical protein